VRLQRTDFEILRHLLGRPTESLPLGSLTVPLADIASSAKIHRNTARRRIQAMTKGGVLDGYLFEPRPRWLGLVRAGHVFLGTEFDGMEELSGALQRFPFVSIAALHTNSSFLHTWHRSVPQVGKDIQALKAALGAKAAHQSYRSDLFPPHPSDVLPLTPLDQRLLLELRRRPDRSATSVAKALGLGRRTIGRRLNRLAGFEAGSLLPMIHPARIEGNILAVFDLDDSSQEARAQLAQAFPERLMGPTGGATHPMVLVPLSNVDEAIRRRNVASQRARLKGIRMSLLREWLFPEACDQWLAQNVQNAPPPAPKA
jgi:DNA-binding Lrp family transcriptional regulator